MSQISYDNTPTLYLVPTPIGNLGDMTYRSIEVLKNSEVIFSEDTSHFLNHYRICVRAGNHCAKMVKDEIGIKNTCRISLYLYNTKEEIDRFIEVMKGSKDIFKVII